MVDAVPKGKTKDYTRDMRAQMLLTLGVVFLILIMQRWLDNLFPNEYYVEKVALYIALFLGSGYLYEPLKRVAWKLRGRHEV